MEENLNILVLDDEEDIAETTCDVIQDFGYYCEYRTNSKEALAHVKNNQVHLIVLDIILNEQLSGIELIPKFKALNPEVVIIMLTGEYNIKSAIQAMRAGADDYILKPLDFEFLEERLRLAEGKVKNEALSKVYFNTIVHDLKNPVTTLNLFTNALYDMPYYKTDERFKKFLQVGRQATETISKMVSNILSIDKFSAGKYKLSKAVINVKACVEEALQIFKPINPGEKERVKVNFSIPPSLTIISNQELYQHILYNLVSNGQRYSVNELALEVEVGLQEDVLQTSVKNRGSYVKEENREIIFDKFSQIKNKKDTIGNFGLGLTFCKVAVECLGGRIWVESDKKKQETIFFYTIPVK